MSFFFPSLWDDQDDFFDPYTTLSQFLCDMTDQRIQRQKAQQHRQCGCYQKPHKEDKEEAEEVIHADEDEGAMSDSEVLEAHQKREEQKQEEEEEAKEVAKEIAEEAARFEKERAERAARLEKERVFIPAADVVDTDTHFIIAMNMPGMKKDDIHVSLEKGILTVSGERPQPCADAKTSIIREIPHGKMERQFEVPEGTKPDDIFAKVEDGVLTLTIKKSVASAPRKIEIA